MIWIACTMLFAATAINIASSVVAIYRVWFFGRLNKLLIAQTLQREQVHRWVDMAAVRHIERKFGIHRVIETNRR